MTSVARVAATSSAGDAARRRRGRTRSDRMSSTLSPASACPNATTSTSSISASAARNEADVANVTPTRRIAVRRCCARGRRGCRPRTRASRRSPSGACTDTTTIAPPTITSTRPGSSPGLWRRCSIGSVASVRNTSSAAARRQAEVVDAVALGRRRRRARSRRASTPCPRSRSACSRCAAPGTSAVDVGEVVAHDRHGLAQLLGGRADRECRNCSVSRTQPMSIEHSPSGSSVPDDELGRAAADVDHEIRRGLAETRRSRPRNSRRASSSPESSSGRTPSTLLGRVEEVVAVRRVARRAGRRRAHALDAELVDDVAVLAQRGERALDRVGMQAARVGRRLDRAA